MPVRSEMSAQLRVRAASVSAAVLVYFVLVDG